MNQQSLFTSDDGEAGRLDRVVVYSDGGARGNPGPAAIGAIVLDPSFDPPQELATVSRYIGETTNNVAEYEALIAGLEAAAPFAPRRICVRADSLLVVNQLLGKWKIKVEHLKPLHARARELLNAFDEVTLEHVRRHKNVDADALVNAALDAELG